MYSNENNEDDYYSMVDKLTQYVRDQSGVINNLNVSGS